MKVYNISYQHKHPMSLPGTLRFQMSLPGIKYTCFSQASLLPYLVKLSFQVALIYDILDSFSNGYYWGSC